MSRWLAPPGPEASDPVAPTFSVIVAAYQVADTIGEALESAFAQTQPPHEVVVCDDGSTDDLDAALAPYIDRIVLVRQPNRGEGAAKNAATRAASGEFVVILDGDDVFLPERLAALAELAAARPDLDILTTDAYLEVDGEVARRCYTADWTFEVDDQRGAILERNFVFGLAAVRRETLLAAGGFDEQLRQGTTDWDCWVRLILGGARAGCVLEPLARYRLRATSLTSQRAALMRGRVVALSKTAARTDLTPGERARLRRTIRRQRALAALAEAHEGLAAGSAGARRLALAAALTPGVPPASRIRSALAAVAPRAAGRRLARRRAETGWVGAAGVAAPPSGAEEARP